MQQATTGKTPATPGGPKVESNRAVWIYTGYAAAVLGLLGILAYHFSGYLLR